MTRTEGRNKILFCFYNLELSSIWLVFLVEAIKTAGVHQFYLVVRTQEKESKIYLKLLSAGAKGMAFELGEGDDFRDRSENFKRTLMSLGKTISTATR